MDNEVVTGLASITQLFNVYKITLLIIGGTLLWGIAKLVMLLGQKLMLKLPNRRLFILQIITLFTFAWYIGGSISLLAGVINPPQEVLLAAAGSAAVALGFALKDIVASLVAGILLLFDKPFRVGDRVKFNDVYGEIMSIGLRSVRLQTLDDNLVTIPNSRFITETVSSGNAGALDMMVVADFHLGLNADITKAKELISEVVVTSRFAYLKKPVSFTLLEKVIANRLVLCLSVKAYVLDVKYEKAFQSDVVIRATQLIQEAQIARP